MVKLAIKSKKLLIFAGVSILSITSYYIYQWYTTPPNIHTTSVEWDHGKTFDIERAIKTSKDVKSKEITSGEINTSKLGEQVVTVKVTNHRGVSTEKDITVNVVDNSPPKINVPSQIHVEVGTEVNLKDYIKVTDNIDLDLNNHYVISDYHTDEIGEQIVEISVEDSSKNRAKKEITLNVVDTKKPTITASNREVVRGHTIDLMEGVKAIDNYDGDITKNIEIVGEVDFDKPGNYPIKYFVSDSSGNKTTTKITVTVKNLTPMTIYVDGKTIPYFNGGKENGQSIIDRNPVASTWGGEPVFSGADNKNTHFIGHNPGIFQDIWKAKTFIITDKDGTPFTYIVTRVYEVDDHAIGVEDGVNYWERITSKDGGERVVFQTCKTDTINYIVEAKLQK